ncbi:hypothetical protein EW146_g5198 [Bondarzewia mesenterica]|uniref:Uncharacterized protein n=1 Tax=Bondarzewia mesenterica TaxID=1095465 RepID=A0A4S4LS85_9AGAM|nr:hypothetical protein EW146_g5198 [Bondarzewia mesenterica]
MAQIMYYGYVPTEEWLVQYGVKKNLGKADTPWHASCTVLNAAFDIFRRTGPGGCWKLPVVYVSGGKASCLAIASSNPMDQMPMPSPEKIQRLKEVLGTEREPQWYRYAG